MSFYSKIVGIIGTTLQIGTTGPKIKNSSGVIELRNAADSAYAATKLARVTCNIYDIGNSGATKTVDWSNGQVQKVTLTEACAFTLSNGVAGTQYRLYLIENGTGGYAISWVTSITWDKATEPTWVTTANSVNIAVLDYDGTTWRGAGWTPS